MRIWALDDEKTALNILTRAIRAAAPEAELASFDTSSALLRALGGRQGLPDVLFLDIEIPEMTGLELARLVKGRAPRVNVVFVTGHGQYALEALSMRPSGYVLKPADADQIRAELANLRDPPARTVPPKRVRVQCFGDFEIFVDGKTLAFTRSKSKELLAYLVDRRGANCTAAKIASALWEDGLYDRARAKLFSVIYADMIKSLRQAGAEHIVRKTNNVMAVDPDAFDCDYYLALSGDTVSVNSFMGEYMAAYSWAEYTTAALFANFAPGSEIDPET